MEIDERPEDVGGTVDGPVLSILLDTMAPEIVTYRKRVTPAIPIVLGGLCAAVETDNHRDGIVSKEIQYLGG